jgi:hypothetical protein
MNDEWERPATTTGRLRSGETGQPPPNDGSTLEDDGSSVLMGSRRGRGILTPPERVDVGQIHHWCLIKATQAEMDEANLMHRRSYLLETGMVYSDQFITYQGHARPFLQAEAQERFEPTRKIYQLSPTDAFMLQQLRGALDRPQLMSSLERRVLLAQFPDDLKERKEWQRYTPQPTVIPLLTLDQLSFRKIGYELEDGEVVHIEDTQIYGVVVSIAPCSSDDSIGLTEEDLERIHEHVAWVKEGRRNAAE